MCGMFDSLGIKCPNCGKELEFQSKSGPCGLHHFTKRNLSIDVAIGMDGDVVKCQFCNSKWKFKLLTKWIAKFKLVRTSQKENYTGNYNSDHPDSIAKAEELNKIIENGKSKS